MTSRRRPAAVAALLVATAVLVLGPAPPAAAHQVDPSVLTVIDAISPAVAGLHIQVAPSVTTELLVANDTDQVLEVLADTGEAFLRIGPDGVEANLASPSWYLTNQPFGTDAVPAGASPGAAPRWVRVSSEPSWGWFDHRLHPTDVVGPLGDRERPTFRVPMRYRGAPLVVRGHLERRTTVPVFSAALRSVPDPSAGLVVQLLDGRAPGLFVRYDGPGEAVVQGAEGEPFLRLGPAGAEVNRHSPTWLFSAQARGEDLAGAEADPSAPPEWASVSSSPSYAWIDRRALIEDVGDQPVVRSWTVPVVVDGQALAVQGQSSAALRPLAVPPAAGSSSSGGRLALAVGGTAATLLVVGGLVLSRRRAPRAG